MNSVSIKTAVNNIQSESTISSGTRVQPFFHDLGLTAVTEFAALVAAFLLVSLFGRLLGAIALGEYLLLRRVASWLQGVVQLGLGTALTRHVAHAADSQDGKRETYFLIAMGISLSAAAVLAIVLFCLRPTFARLFFGKEDLQGLILPLILMLFGSAMHASVYAYYRGRLFMRLANGVQFCDMAAAPIIAIALFSRSHSVAVIINCIGILMFISSSMFAIPIFIWRARGIALHLKLRAAEMLHYALPRFAGDVALGGLMALPPILASHYMAMSRTVYLLLGASMLTAFSASVGPLGIILLSKASMMLTQGRVNELRDRLDLLVAAVLELSVFGCLQLMVFTDVVVRVWVGRSFLEGTLVVRILLAAVPFYVLYATLRSVVDAVSITAYNSGNVLVVLAGVLIAILLVVKLAPASFVLEGIALAWVCSLAGLGWLTGRTLRQLLGFSIHYRRMLAPFSVAAALAGASLMVHWINGFRTGVLAVVLLEFAAGTIFLGSLRRLGPWFPYVWNAIFRKPVVSEMSLTES